MLRMTILIQKQEIRKAVVILIQYVNSQMLLHMFLLLFDNVDIHDIDFSYGISGSICLRFR